MEGKGENKLVGGWTDGWSKRSRRMHNKQANLGFRLTTTLCLESSLNDVSLSSLVL